MNPSLSVVIIGRNEGDRLTRCIESVLAMPSPPEGREILYVDSGSTDDSTQRAGALGAKVIPVQAARPTAAIGRNAGWRAANGEYILFLDGDTVLHPDFAPAALAVIQQDSSIAVVWGHRREMFPNANFFHRVLDLDWVYRAGMSEFCGGDALMRRSVLEQTGGFDESLIAGEEPDLCLRLRRAGYAILHIDAPMTLHDLAISRFSQYWRRAFRAGYAYAQAAFRSRTGQLRLWSRESRGNVVHALALVVCCATLGLPHVRPLAAAAIAGLIVRTAWRARWKSDDIFSLLCYGVHSHMQHIPIFVGQVAFWLDHSRTFNRGLIEYK